jgi:hypothetical protein
MRGVKEGLDRLTAACEMVSVSSDVLGGTPVIKGTRIPVHDVAASISAGLPTAHILAAYAREGRPKSDSCVKSYTAMLYDRLNEPALIFHLNN